MHTRRSSLLYSLALLCVSNLTLALTPWESIHQTIHTYPLAIDSKDFALLSKVSKSQISASKTPDRIITLCLFAQYNPSVYVVNLPSNNRSSRPAPPPTTPAISPISTAFQQSRPRSQHRLPTSTPNTSSAPPSSTSTATESTQILPPTSKPAFSANLTLSALWCLFTDTIRTPLRERLRGGESRRGCLCSRGRASWAI